MWIVDKAALAVDLRGLWHMRKRPYVGLPRAQDEHALPQPTLEICSLMGYEFRTFCNKYELFLNLTRSYETLFSGRTVKMYWF